MKKSFLLLVSMAFIVFVHAQDTIRVNNNAGITADYTTLQDAHDGATAGDVIYLENSSTGYGDCVFTKELTVIGMGYFLGENDSTPAQKAGTIVGGLTFEPGSANSVIQGLYVSYVLSIKESNIVIRRNRLSYVYLSDWSNPSECIIEQNYIAGYMIESNTSFHFNNFIISNNIISSYIRMNGGSSGTIRNNIICAGGSNSENTFNGSTVENNIFYDGFVTSSNTTLQHNLFANSGTDSVGNQYNVDMNTVFKLSGSTDGKWQLKEGSPAIGAASDGVSDCGVFSGTNPYKLSGIPPVPYIYNAIIPTSGSTSGGLNVQVKIRSND